MGARANSSLFDSTEHLPLAEKLRPVAFQEVLGQEALSAEHGTLRRMIESGHYHSVILWGPPGCGKTTIARLLAAASACELETVSAVQSGVAELKKIFDQARMRLRDGKRTVLFVDEIHRFNRAQQDAFLPVVEDGTIILVGATTENPSFEINSALLSRCRVVVLSRLSAASLDAMIGRAESYYGHSIMLQPEARASLCAMADGDGRFLLNMVEEIVEANLVAPIDTDELVRMLQKRAPIYDKHQDSHYNLISALHKSMRGSDVDAALYWFARMLDGGEDPLYVARRLIRFASEDIGMADPEALVQAMTAKAAYECLGSPEGELAIAQAVIYLATAPKSNAQYVAYKRATKSAKEHGSLMPPRHILNAPTTLMKEIGYGSGYAYDHDTSDGFSGQNYFPETMTRESYYQPVERGFERDILKSMDYWSKLRSKRQEEQS